MNALQAGVMNVPFAPVRGLLHPDYMKVRPDFRTRANPYDPAEEIALVPAIAPDVAVFHGFRGDRAGNVVTSGTLDAKLIAQASRVTIATVEDMVEAHRARRRSPPRAPGRPGRGGRAGHERRGHAGRDDGGRDRPPPARRRDDRGGV